MELSLDPSETGLVSAPVLKVGRAGEFPKHQGHQENKLLCRNLISVPQSMSSEQSSKVFYNGLGDRISSLLAMADQFMVDVKRAELRIQ